MKRYIKLGFVCLCFLYSFTLCAASLTIGKLAKGSLIVDVNNTQIETYNIFNVNYISVSKLKKAGFQVAYTSSHEPIFITAPAAINENIQDLTKADLDGKAYTNYTGEVYIGHLKTHAISCEGNLLIPVAALNELFSSSLADKLYMLTPKVEAPVIASQTSIKNCSAETIEVSVNDLYWDNKLIQKTLYFTLEPYAIIERQPSSDKKYLTSIVATAVSPTLNYRNTSLCGQNNEPLLRRLAFANSLPEEYGDAADISTLYNAFETVNSKKLTSKTKYLVWTNLDQQRTYVFQNENGTWCLLRHFICSSGKSSSPTPKGTYKLTRKVPSFGQDHGYCCKNAFGFIGTTYLYHSILFDRTGTYLLEGRGVLGKKASNGCIRLSPENSLWFYNNMIAGTTVWIS